MRRVVVPACIHRVAHDVSDLGEDVLDKGLVSAQRDALPQVRSHAHHHALTWTRDPVKLPLVTPALQLYQHRLQLEIPRLLVQQAEVLREQSIVGGQDEYKHFR